MRQAQELLGVLEPGPVMATVHGALPPPPISLEGFGFLEAIKSLSGGGTCEQRVIAIPLLDVGFQDQDG